MNGGETRTEKLISELIRNSKNVGIFTSDYAGGDSFAACAGIYHALKEAGKEVSIIFPWEIKENQKDLVEPQGVLSDVTKRSLVVSIDYSSTPASKVHYTTNNDVLELVLSPVNKEFKLENIKTEIIGFSYDLIITLGVHALGDLGQAYKEMETDFDKAKVINIDNSVSNQRYGTVYFIRDREPALSMLVLNNINSWGLRMNVLSAKSLLKGIEFSEIK